MPKSFSPDFTHKKVCRFKWYYFNVWILQSFLNVVNILFLYESLSKLILSVFNWDVKCWTCSPFWPLNACIIPLSMLVYHPSFKVTVTVCAAVLRSQTQNSSFSNPILYENFKNFDPLFIHAFKYIQACSINCNDKDKIREFIWMFIH